VEATRALSDVPGPVVSPFAEWDRLTRFLESARVAFARERMIWESLGIDDSAEVTIASSEPQASYVVGVGQHLAAVGDAEMLHASVLIHSYALAEATAARRLGADARTFNGIEDWGARLLATTGRDWSGVKGGLAVAVQLAVVRNAFAHGSRTVDAAARARLFSAGAETRPVGARITLPYPQLRGYRNRLLELLAAGGITRA
jgi:hypothetical protein